jgi:predicted transcriptional regulator
MAGTAQARQINSNKLASDWVMKAMALAALSRGEVSRRSGIPEMTIYNILHQKNKTSCRLDTLVLIITSCGFTFRDFKNIMRSL